MYCRVSRHQGKRSKRMTKHLRFEASSAETANRWKDKISFYFLGESCSLPWFCNKSRHPISVWTTVSHEDLAGMVTCLRLSYAKALVAAIIKDRGRNTGRGPLCRRGAWDRVGRELKHFSVITLLAPHCHSAFVAFFELYFYILRKYSIFYVVSTMIAIW